MSSLEEVTNQLMKPVKELADWEYPLSEILGKYYALLENPGEINYGEAAYVVQNSTEVFTKRVDCLGKEVCVLSENFLQHEAEEEKSKLKSKERRSRKTAINFDNFELIDFHKEIGKNINLKPSSQKPVKLLNRRFPQLEIATTQIQNPVDIYDIHGEIIGKKYDFRCNQQLTVNGMLVDECTPSDFDVEILRVSDLARSPPTDQIEVSDLSLPDITTQLNETTQEDTGYFSLINSTRNDQSDIQNSLLDNNEISVIERNTTLDSIEEISENIQENKTEISSDEQSKVHESSATFSETIEETRNDEETTIESSTNLQDSGNETVVPQESTVQRESIIQHELSEELSSTVLENENVTTSEQEKKSQETSETAETIDTTRNEESTMEQSDKFEKNKDSLENVQENTETNIEIDRTEDDEPSHFDDVEMDRDDDDDADDDNVNEEVENSEKLENGKTPTECSNEKSKSTEENHTELIENNETDSGYRSGESEDFEIPRRRSKRSKNMVCVADDLNENVWKPIPFDQGIPAKLPKSRSKFKLPCHISLLKSKPNSRKRKLPTEEKKRKRNLLGFLTNESPESPLKKLNMYSPSRPFMPLKTEELSEFQKSFEDCLKSRQCYDVFQYEAATTITMDLLGFFPTFTKKDPLLHTTGFKTLAPTPEHISTSGSDAGFSPRPTSPEIVIFDTTNSPPDSPRVSETYEAETNFETENFHLEEESPLHSTFNYQKIIESRMKEIHQEFDVRTDLEQNVARWHEMIRPKLEEIERRPPFNIHEYSDLIIKKLEETMERKIPFEQLIVDQSPGEAARYFSAALQLANTYNVDIKTSEKNTDIQLALLNNDLTRHEISCETPEVSRSKKKKFSKHLA